MAVAAALMNEREEQKLAAESLFYCVACNQIVRKDNAHKLFRTGYFRIHYRLGCCESCRSSPDKERDRHKAFANER